LEMSGSVNADMCLPPGRSGGGNQAVTTREAFYNVFRFIFCSPLSLLLLFAIPGIGGSHWKLGPGYLFFSNFLAIVPLAKILGWSTEELAMASGDVVGGLLNATFGNAVEMMLSVFALREGLVDVVQGSLLGSILSNLLLVLGMCFLCGGIYNHTQKFNADGARSQSVLLLIAVLGMAIPSIASAASDAEGRDHSSSTLFISRGAAVVLGIVYCFYLLFQLKTHPEAFASSKEEGEDEEEEEAQLTVPVAVLVLLVSTLIVAVCSEGLVGSIEGVSESFGLPRNFIGIVLLPIVGNAAEHTTAITVAIKNKMDLAINVALGSSSQIALLVVPFTVLIGWAMSVPMDLDFGLTNTAILVLVVIIVGSITTDGESNWLEGMMLCAAYSLVMLTYWFL